MAQKKNEIEEKRVVGTGVEKLGSALHVIKHHIHLINAISTIHLDHANWLHVFQQINTLVPGYNRQDTRSSSIN